ncbi:hypothetical protein [Gulosibacter faecalis]|jgi:hypothetical protein|uniref:Uncharacterized protein n=1 Tax=Gulosibacter faecalis TaxID=272240 RepID=A0ABW5UV88_9MICO|nr:hypothetical protein [Gulosibacter faecalis]
MNTKNPTTRILIGAIGVVALGIAAISALITNQVLPVTYIGLIIGILATVATVVGFVRGRKLSSGMISALVTPAVAVAALTPVFSYAVGVAFAVIAVIFAVEIIVLLAVRGKHPAKGQLRHG